MTRNRTTFQPGHERLPGAGFQKGNRLPVKHGAMSPAVVEERMPAIRAEVEAELASLPYVTAPDASLVRSYCYLTTQARLMQEWYDRNGGMFTSRGGVKKSANFYLALLHRQQELAKVLGLGAVPRAQVARDMAGAGRDVAEVRAAQERLRQRQLKVVNGGLPQLVAEATE